MTAQLLVEDEPFFREWLCREPGERRSLRRAAELAHHLGVNFANLPPCLVVVGSKGKGTAVAFASATLDTCGLKVGTISSPPFRTNRERIRYGGVELSDREYSSLSQRVSRTIEILPERTDGYLSPVGTYLMAGLAWLVRRGVDVLVSKKA